MVVMKSIAAASLMVEGVLCWSHTKDDNIATLTEYHDVTRTYDEHYLYSSSNRFLQETLNCRCPFTVFVQTDNYESETTWTLDVEPGDSDEAMVVANQMMFEDNTLYEYTVCLNMTGTYTITLFDEGGHGISDPVGYYNYSVCDGTTLYRSGDEFYAFAQSEFELDDDWLEGDDSKGQESLNCICPFTVFVQTDNYGNETTWTLDVEPIDSDETIVVANQMMFGDNTFYNHTVCLDIPGIYTFTIFDEGGNGIADPLGYYIYSVCDGTTGYNAGDEFNAFDQSEFELDEDYFEDCTCPFTVYVQTDNYGNETTWTLDVEPEDSDETMVVANQMMFEDNTLHEYTVCLNNTGTYTFTLFDKGGNGISDPVGYYNYSVCDGTTLSMSGDEFYAFAQSEFELVEWKTMTNVKLRKSH